MKSLIKNLRTSLILGCVVCFTACTEDTGLPTDVVKDDGEFYMLTAKCPNYVLTDVISRANGNEEVERITALYYKNDDPANADEDYLCKKEITGFTQSGGDISLYLPKVKDARYIHLVVNAEIGEDEKNAASVFVTHNQSGSDSRLPIFWGKALLPVSGNIITEMALIHNDVKVSVETSPNVSNFVLDPVNSFGVFGVMTKGSVAPKDWNMNTTAVTLPEEKVYTPLTGDDSALRNTAFYVFETDSDKAKIIIKGYYNGNESASYYVAGFADSSQRPIDIIRGRHYRLLVEKVNTDGWPTLSEALAALPDNRLSVTITDVNDDIVDIIACKDYALGVNRPMDLPSSATPDTSLETTLKIVTSYESVPTVTIEQNSWALLGEMSRGEELDGTSPREFLYTMKVMTRPNEESTPRSVTVTVRCGDLQREVRINQAAAL